MIIKYFIDCFFRYGHTAGAALTHHMVELDTLCQDNQLVMVDGLRILFPLVQDVDKIAFTGSTVVGKMIQAR